MAVCEIRDTVLDYGRNYGVTYDIGAWTDVLIARFGGDTDSRLTSS
ncbi:porin [Salmonella enterica subsp. enterica serovar Weltevreden]|nr:porin [Salmonella enterica subsp. enterica serovar Weltevreden]